VDKKVSFEGMRMRAAVDTFNLAAGLRILRDDAANYPNGERIKRCPDLQSSVGSIRVPSMPLTSGEKELADLSGFATSSGGWIGVCYAPSKTRVELTLPEGCPAGQQRGAIFVKEAEVKKGLGDRSPWSVVENWVVLCSGAESDWRAYFSLARLGCDAGGSNAGSFRAYRDCYDAKGRKCEHSNGLSEAVIVCAGK